MREQTRQILEDLEILFPGEGFEGHRLRISDAIQPAIIKYQYHERLAMNPGESEAIKRELAEKYHISVATVDKYISRI